VRFDAAKDATFTMPSGEVGAGRVEVLVTPRRVR
jgi:hypothetical protein